MFRMTLLFFVLPMIGFGQDYTSYFTGNTIDKVTNPKGGICLMGGATEDDNAMKWFLRQANGGDILILRASGSNGYNNYLYTGLGVPVNSVETIVCKNIKAGTDPYVLQKIKQAEAIWFAGGDQWNYVSYWRNTPVDSLINHAIKNRKIVIGGTSAGMAIQGQYYFSAKNGTVTSSVALSNPYHNLITVDSTAFISNKDLKNVITDTHFDNPDRKGRLVTFMARIYSEYGEFSKAIACDEYTAVCIDTSGKASVYGGFPANDDNAYFIQTNCEIPNRIPEICSHGLPLTWNRGGQALKVYQIKGTSDGLNTFDLQTWQNGTGGLWKSWSVENAVLTEQSNSPIMCSPLSSISSIDSPDFYIYPNPCNDQIIISSFSQDISKFNITIHNLLGQQIPIRTNSISNNRCNVEWSDTQPGLYILKIDIGGSITYSGTIVKQ